MNFVITSNSVFESVRVLEIYGEPWFVGKDVCRVFGDTDHKRSLARLDSDEKSTAIITDSLGRKQSATIINESGLYSLIFSFEPSKARKDGGADMTDKVKARLTLIKAFRKWVTSEVLPSIRKQGIYLAEQKKEELLYQAFQLANEILNEYNMIEQED